MTGGRPVPATRRIVRLGAACLVVSAVSLPALVAGAHLGAPADPGEYERLAAALGAGGGPSEVARQFLVAALGGGPETWPDGAAERAALLGAARLAQVGGVLGLSLCIYLITTLARGRLQALLACGLFAVVPAVATGGHVLRPETAGTLFVAFAALLLQCLAQAERPGPGRGPARRTAVVLLLAASAALALGLAIAALPALGGCLLMPGALMAIAALQLAARALRIRRARTWYRVPVRAINARLWPWTLVALLGPCAGWWLMLVTLRAPAEALRATGSSLSLLPATPWAAVPLLALLGLGAAGGIVRIGLRFARRGRIGADLVLLAYCATQLAYAAGRGGVDDLLPASPALAVLLAEGAFHAMALAVVLVARWRAGSR